jgi:hypothetical protein
MVMEAGIIPNTCGSCITLVGLGDTTDGSEFVDGVYFEYQAGSSANWRIGTANNSTRTETTTGTAVAGNTYVTLRWVINSAATSVEYFINGASVGTIATNIPTTRQSGPIIVQDNSGAITLSVDFYNLYRDLSADRT